jgi:hypothetical protein
MSGSLDDIRFRGSLGHDDVRKQPSKNNKQNAQR